MAPEHRAKLSASMTLEARAKLSAANTGRAHSAVTRERMSAAQRKWRQSRVPEERPRPERRHVEISDMFELHGYQRVAADHLRRNPRAALWLDMGLGKTATTLAALTPDHLPALVIAPKRVVTDVWPREAARWRPGVKYRARYSLSVLPRRAPPSSRKIWGHRSSSPFGLGVPVSCQQ